MSAKKDTHDESAVDTPQDADATEVVPRKSRRASRGNRGTRRTRIIRERAQTQEQPTVTAEDLFAEPADPTEADPRPATPAKRTVLTTSDDELDPTDGELELESEDELEGELVDPVGERRRWILLTAFLAVTALAMVGVSLYLANVIGQWEQRAADLTEVNYELGEEIADAQDTIEVQTTRIDVLTTQLNTAKDRITELANETANYDDDRAYTAQQIEQLEGLASTGAAVANALTRCLDGEEQLVAYLEDAENYDEEEILAYQESVNELCTAARDSNTAFQKLLNG